MLSNKGNVKLMAYLKDKFITEEHLYLGYGLYVTCNELSIWNVGKDKIYRLVYKLFKGDIPRGYQIHHLDYNHYNNDINNLVCVTGYEHGQYHINSGRYYNGIIPHKEDELYSDYQLWLKANDIKERICACNYTALDAKEDVLNKIYTMFENKSIPIREQIKQERKEQIQLKKQQREENILKERELKLQSGEYAIDKNGNLYATHKPKWTDERHNKTIQTRKTSESWNNRGEKISATLQQYYSILEDL